jgi:predicted tellurium resistance membrane protein TerC
MRSWAFAVALTFAVDPKLPYGASNHATLAEQKASTREELDSRAKVERSAFFEHAKMAISDRGAQAAVLAQSVVDMMDEDKRRLVVEKMEQTHKEKMRSLEVAADREAAAAQKVHEADPDSFVIAPSVLSMGVEKHLPPKQRHHRAVKDSNPEVVNEEPEAAYTVSTNDYLAVFGAFGCLTLFFAARVAHGLDDPVLIAKELVFYTLLFMPACAAYMGISVGSPCVWSLLQCCIADMLMGFDNLLDLSGWYSNTNISMYRVTLLLVVGGFIQLNLRFALSVGVHFLTGQVDNLSRLAGCLVVLCGLRTMWFSSSIEKQGEQDMEGKLQKRKKEASFMEMVSRAAIVELTDALGSLDSLCGKLVSTRDLLVINASSFVGVFFVRGLSIVLLLNMAKKSSQEYDRFSLPTEVFLPFVGILLLLIGFHGIFPGDVPAIPPFANIAIACSIYGYLTFRLFSLSRRKRKPSLTE